MLRLSSANTTIPYAMTTPKLTARSIGVTIFNKLHSASELIIPRYTPPKWWECDVWRLTKSGYEQEFEIKLTMQDYRIDVLKERSTGWVYDPSIGRMAPREAELKHDLLAGSDRGPQRFWYVVPDAMMGVEVPEYAGLMVAGRYSVAVLKEAPKRHKRKWEGDRADLLRSFYHRYWAHEARHAKA